jgi:DNA polymerase-3 subunit beta
MKIIVRRNILFAALSRIQGIVDKVSIKPITSNFLIEAGKDTVVFSATNLQLAIKSTYSNIEIIEKGNVSINAKNLFELIKKLPEGNILIEEKENYRIIISSGKNIKYTLFGLPPEEYPFSMTVDEKDFISWNIEKFLNLIKLTSFCISKDDSKQNISGLFVEYKDNEKTRIVSTDGYRLSVVEENCGMDKISEKGFIIPYKAVLEINRLMNEKIESKEVEVCVVNNSLLLKIEEVEVLMKLIDKKFPDYNLIIPEESLEKINILIDKEKIKESLERIIIISNISNEKNIAVKFNFKGKTLELFSEDSEKGSAKELIEIEKEVEKEITFFINGMYLLDFINVIEKNIIIEIVKKEKNKPIVIRPEGIKDKKYIIMPMTIN